MLALFATTASAEDEVLLKRGDLLHGTIIERGADYIVLEHTDLGRFTIPMRNIESIKLGRPVQATPPGAPPPPLPSGPVIPRVPDKAEWQFSFVLGGVAKNNDDGEDFDLNTRMHVERITPVSESRMFLSYIYGDSDGERDDNAFTGILKQTFLARRTPWLSFGVIRYDWDEFRAWDYRWTLHGGLGYRIFDSEVARLFPKVGGGYRKDFGSEDEVSRGEGLLGFELNWHPGKLHTVSLDATYYPSLNENEYRLVPIFDWKFRIQDDSPLSLNFRLEYEWATDPDPGFPRDTYRATWGVQVDL